MKDDGPCLVVTESQENSAKFLYVLRRWLPLTLFIRGVHHLCTSTLYMLSQKIPSVLQEITMAPAFSIDKVCMCIAVNERNAVPAETDGECSISVLPESARALGLPPDSMAEVVYSVVPYSCISLIGVRPAVERGISTGHRAGEHTVAVSRQ